MNAGAGGECPHVAVVGGGFSGTAIGMRLVEAGVAVTLIERDGRFAAGLAYGTPEPWHLLNVRAEDMSALPDTPDHFAEWMVREGEGAGSSFAPRVVYRRYLAELFAAYRQPRLTTIEAEVTGWSAQGPVLASGRTVAADATVIAAGNLLPEVPAVFADAGARYINEPWSPRSQAALKQAAADGRDILLVGTGLTAVDAVLSLDAHGFRGRVLALSRRGLLPRAHVNGSTAGVAPARPAEPGTMLRALRRQARDCDWRAAVDALRPITADIWTGWTIAERGRFLRHARPWWDVHRHRIAPEVADRLHALMGAGQLRIAAGRIEALDEKGVRVRFRGEEACVPVEADAIVNCTGPQGDLRRTRDPLIADLLRSRAATTDAFGLGLDVDKAGRMIGGAGAPTPGLYAVGPMTKGRFWECVAVPDIRIQAARLGETIAADLRGRPVIQRLAS